MPQTSVQDVNLLFRTTLEFLFARVGWVRQQLLLVSVLGLAFVPRDKLNHDVINCGAGVYC